MRARGAAGQAGGALGGLYPDPSHGAPSVAGYRLSDDFLVPPDGGRYGDMRWQAINMGSAPTLTQVTPTATTESGILRMATNAAGAVDEGGLVGWPVAGGRQFSAAPQVGALYVAKLRLESTTNIRVFSGLLQNQSAWWTGTNDCIGFRTTVAAVAANWYGVVRDGTSETTVDLLVTADGTWQSLMWRREIDEDGNSGVQFYVATQGTAAHNYNYPVVWAATGAFVTTNLPDDAMTFCPLGVASRTITTSKSADVDLIEWGGPARRVA